MPSHINPQVSPIDDLAAQFKRFNQRIASLERVARGAGAGGAGFVSKAGDTMSGPLYVRSSTLGAFSNITVGPAAGQAGSEGGQINFEGTASYPSAFYIDRESNTLRFVLNGQVVGGFTGVGTGFIIGSHPVHGAAYASLYRADASTAANYAILQTAGGNDTYFGAASTFHWQVNSALVAQMGSSFIRLYGNCNIQWASHSNLGFYAQDATWIRTSAPGNLYLGGGWLGTEGGVTVGFAGATDATWKIRCSTNIYAAGTVRGDVMLATSGSCIATSQVQSQRGGYTDWSNMGMLVNPGSINAGYAAHPGGVAPTWIVHASSGNFWYARDSAGNAASCQIFALAYLGDSSRRWKRNIADWPLRAGGAASLAATDVTDRLRPVTYDLRTVDEQVLPLRREKARQRLNRIRARRGDDPIELDAHDSAVHDCDGTADDPCARTLNSRHARFGLIAEEVIEVIPEAVAYDHTRQPGGIDYAQITTVLLAAVQELTGRVRYLEGALLDVYQLEAS